MIENISNEGKKKKKDSSMVLLDDRTRINVRTRGRNESRCEIVFF